MSGEYIFAIKNLTSYNKDGYFIENVSFNLKPGEIHAIVGESGAGKNTLIKSLLGNIDNISGEIVYNNKVINLDETFKGLDSIPILYDMPNLVDEMSVSENLFLKNLSDMTNFFKLVNWSKINKKSKNIFENLNINIDPNKDVYELTKEEKIIIEIARSFLQNNSIVVMHEPANGLGADKMTFFYKLLNKYKNKNYGILYVTKEWEEALRVADRISVLSKGTVVDTLLAESAKKNPKKLINMLIGITDKDNSSEKEGNSRVLDTVFKAAEFLTSEYELKDVLVFITEHAAKIMNADKCILNLIDEKTNTFIDTVIFNDNMSTKLKKETILNIIENNSLYYATKNDKEFSTLFEEFDGVKTIISIPVLIRSHVAGCIQLFYQNFYVYSEAEALYLSTLARQAAIAIEDTRLMGRSAMLRESHHRIKNNLQYIISLVILQKQLINNNNIQSISDILNNIISRIQSIAAVHDLLSKNEFGRSIINIKEIIEVIVDFYKVDTRVKLELNLDNIFISYSKATSIALIVNELVNNCFEHAFPDNKKGVIQINCLQNDDIILIVEDNGTGISEDFDIDELDSLGLSIVHSIVTDEFKGKLYFENKDRGGTRVRMHLPLITSLG